MALSRTTRAVAVVVVLIVAGLTAVTAAVPALRWRAGVVGLKMKGGLPQFSTLQMFEWLVPNSDVYLGDLRYRPTADAGIENIDADKPGMAEKGQQQYLATCAACHGGDGNGGNAPSLLQFVANSTDWKFFSTAKWGRPGTGMAAQPVTDRQIWEVHAFLRSRARQWVKEQRESTGYAHVERKIDVPYERLAAAKEHPEEWMMYSGDLKGHRHSKLTQIDRTNVKDLRVAWASQLRPAVKPLSATPLMVGGLVYVTEAPDGVVALNARTGEVVWRFQRGLDDSKLPLCCGAFNRGVAIMDNRVFVGTLDSYLIALDATTGERLWETKVAEAQEGYSITSAPLAIDGRIVVGVAGAELGIRGFVAAFAPSDGKELWRFHTVPGPGEPGHDTWEGDSWKTGGASTWSLGTYDSKLDILYWSTGNPWPPFNRKGRAGDNLYSNSIIALNPKTGKLLWHYQCTPADSNDWDATQQMILADIQWQGRPVEALLMASRNAFYYAIDRRDGTFLYAKPFVKQTWAKGIDAKGRPERDPASLPSPAGTVVWPWLHGGTNWWPPSYDAKRNLHFVATVDAATYYFTLDEKKKPGTMTMGGTTVLASNHPAVMAIKAIDPNTGDEKWAARLDVGDFKQFSRVTGLLSTDGSIVVGGFMDRMSIHDSDTGEMLWKFHAGALINAGPSTYTIDGVQYITVIAGNVVFAFSLPPHDIEQPKSAPAKSASAPKAAAKK